MKRSTMIIVIVVLILSLFLWGAYKQSVRENKNMEREDQSAYIDYAKALNQSNFKYIGDRNRMPVYPSLMSLFYREGMSNNDFFRVGKVINTAIALGVAAVMFFLFQKVAPLLDASIATLVIMFTVLVYKAPYFQTEVLFYGINFGLFYLLVSLIRKPSLSSAALAGLIGGLGHLTKASVLPGLLLAGLCLIIRGALSIKTQRNDISTAPSFSSKARYLLTHISYVLILLGCFLVVVYPYIRKSKEEFGRYFYNVNSTFYIWYDSWKEAEEGTKAHGDRVGWPDLPDDQIPSFQKYINEHSPKDIAKRIVNGAEIVWYDVASSYGYVEFIAIYLIATIMLLWQNKDWAKSQFISTNPSLILFIVGYFSGYLLLYSWYMSIVIGNRFVLSLLIPAIYLLLSLLARAQSADLKITIVGRELSASSISPIILLVLLAYLLTIYPVRIQDMYAGE